MLRIGVTIIFIIGVFCDLLANDVRIRGEAKVQALTSNTALITFPLSWDHSWRESESWDAVYLFVKYKRVGVNEPWHHVYLKNSGHRIAGGGSVPAMEFLPVTTTGANLMGMDTIYAGNYNPTSMASQEVVTGAFLFRKLPGRGNLDISRVSLEWDFTQGDLSLYHTVTVDDIRNKKIEVSVQAIEMVFVPNGPYYLGDRVSPYSFVSSDCGSAFFVQSEEETKVYIMGLDGADGVKNSWIVPKSYPKGYTGFYTMKYEVSQEQYANFLNRLTYADQKKHIANDLDKMVPGDFAFGSKHTPNYRNGIMLQERFSTNDSAVIFGFDLNVDDPANSEDDGRSIACNYMTPYDLKAYSDWAGLRPHSEMEYEKSCRPRNPAIVSASRSFAWEWPDFTALTDLNTSSVENGNAEEEHVLVPLKTPQSGRMNGPKTHNIGPVKCGAFANETSGIYEAGASRWGIMELTGNLAEICYNARGGKNFNGGYFGDGNIWSDVVSWRGDSVVRLGHRDAYRCGKGEIIETRSFRLPTINKKNDTMVMTVRYAWPYDFGKSNPGEPAKCGWLLQDSVDVHFPWPVFEWPAAKGNFMQRGGSFATQASASSGGAIVADRMAVSFRGDTIYAKASEEEIRFNYAGFRAGRSVPIKSILTGVIAAENMKDRDTTVICTGKPFAINEIEAGDDTPISTVYVWEVNDSGKGWAVIPNENGQNLQISNCLSDDSLMHIYTFRRQSIASHAQSYGNEVTLVVPGFRVNGGKDNLLINQYVSYVELSTVLGIAGDVKVEWRVNPGDTWNMLSNHFNVAVDRIAIDRTQLAPSIPAGSGGYGTVRVTVTLEGCIFTKELDLSVSTPVAACPGTVVDSEGGTYAVGQLNDSRCWILSDLKVAGGLYSWEDIQAQGDALCPDGFHIATAADWEYLARMCAQAMNLDCDNRDWYDATDDCGYFTNWMLYVPGLNNFITGLGVPSASADLWWIAGSQKDYITLEYTPADPNSFVSWAHDGSLNTIKRPVRCVKSPN